MIFGSEYVFLKYIKYLILLITIFDILIFKYIISFIILYFIILYTYINIFINLVLINNLCIILKSL